MTKTKSLSTILSSIDIQALLNIIWSPSAFVFLYLCVASITVIALGRIMRYPGGILTWTLDSISQMNSERSTKVIGKHQTSKKKSTQ